MDPIETITTGSSNQPYAKFDEKEQVIKLFNPGSYSARDRVLRLSWPKAEELRIELEHAVKMARGEV